MNDFEIRKCEMFVNVRDFVETHPKIFTQDELTGKWRATFLESLQEVKEQAAIQVSGRSAFREASTAKAAEAETLREILDRLRLTAVALAQEDPGLEDKFRLPASRTNQALLNAARAFSRDAAPLVRSFIDHKMPADFIQTLESQIKAFEAAISNRTASRRTHVVAKVGLSKAIETATEALQHLDAVVVNSSHEDTLFMAGWNNVRRMERAWKSKPAKPRSTATSAAATAQP